MDNPLLLQLLALSVYAWFMGFTFCDGFQLHVIRKLIWFSVFLGISVYVLALKNEYDLALILPVPSLLALLLCYDQKRKSSQSRR